MSLSHGKGASPVAPATAKTDAHELLAAKGQNSSLKSPYDGPFAKHGRYRDAHSNSGGVHTIQNRNGFDDKTNNKCKDRGTDFHFFFLTTLKNENGGLYGEPRRDAEENTHTSTTTGIGLFHIQKNNMERQSTR